MRKAVAVEFPDYLVRKRSVFSHYATSCDITPRGNYLALVSSLARASLERDRNEEVGSESRVGEPRQVSQEEVTVVFNHQNKITFCPLDPLGPFLPVTPCGGKPITCHDNSVERESQLTVSDSQ